MSDRMQHQRSRKLWHQAILLFFVVSFILTIPTLVLMNSLTRPTADYEFLDAMAASLQAKNVAAGSQIKNMAASSQIKNMAPRSGNQAQEIRIGDSDAENISPSKHDDRNKDNRRRYAPRKRKIFKKLGFSGLPKGPSVRCGGHYASSCAECPQGNGPSWCNGECRWDDSIEGGQCVRGSRFEHLHPDYFRIIERYAFQPVTNQNHVYVNIIMVRAPFRDRDDEQLYKFYQDEILFLGISSFEAYPLVSPNPYSSKFESEYYLNMFPGFLHTMRDPEKYFPSKVETILMSQSDFMLDDPLRFGFNHEQNEKIYDFVYSGGDQDVATDCVGWASYNKNFSFVREALEVMCSPEFNVTGVLVATKDKKDTIACTIPKKCDGLILQTTFLDQPKFFDYLSKARFAFLPQICDASPRVSTQALSMNLPLLMNRNIMGGWKYLVPGETGEFFHDMSDFKDSLRRILDNVRGNHSPYMPRDFVLQNYGNPVAGKRLYQFVMQHWGDRVDLPAGTTHLMPTGA